MDRRGLALAVLVIVCLVSLAHSLYYYPVLPEQVPHHFNSSGEPDAWSSKSRVLIIQLVLLAALALPLIGIGLAMPRLSDSAINLPNKEFWLSPERRQQTLEAIQARLYWMGALTVALLVDVFHQSFQVALGNATGLSHFHLSLGVYLVLTTLWCIELFRRFSKRANPEDA